MSEAPPPGRRATRAVEAVGVVPAPLLQALAA